MFLTALQSFPLADHYIFICLKEHLQKYSVESIIRRGYPNSQVITADGVTEGQACTCLLAEDHLRSSDEGLFIASCDYQTIYDKKRYDELRSAPEVDVIIWTFKIGAIKKANPNAFAYCRLEDNRVVEVVEKRTISDDPYSDPAVVGSFTYRTSELFVLGAKRMIEKNIRVNGEFYVGTSINQLIEGGYNVVHFEVDEFISFGNPFELMLFQYWEDYFDSLEDHSYSIDYGHRRLRR